MVMGRPKLEISREKQVNIRLTENDFAELEKICAKLKISKTEAILRGLKLLKNPPRQIITRSQLPGYKPPTKKIKNSPGITCDDDD